MKKYLSEMNDLLLDWDHIANSNVDITNVSYGSITKYWWKCHVCGYKWKATMNSRSGKGTGCPCCANKVVVEGKNDLVTTDAWIVSEWNDDRNVGIAPQMYTRGSGKKVWWKCSLSGHEWQASIEHRIKGRGCPICASRKVLAGYNDLGTNSPLIAEEWDYSKNTKKPYEVMWKSNHSAWWKCKKCGYGWYAVISSRVKGAGCPKCAMEKRIEKANEKAIVDDNTLANKYPQLAKEWDFVRNGELMPNKVAPFSAKKVWWKCERCGNEWQAIIANRTKGRGCPRCKLSNQTSLAEQILYQYVHSLFEESISNYIDDKLYPYKLDIFIPSLMLGIEYDGEKWHKDVDQDKRKTRVLSENSISLIRVREMGCPDIDDGSEQIKTKKPDYGSYEYLLDVICDLNVILSKKSIRVILKELDDISEIRNSAVKDYFDELLSGSLAFKYPNIAREWDFEENGDLLPTKVLPKSNLKVGWKCNKCGYKWKTKICYRTLGTNCPRCAGKILWGGHNDLKSQFPELLSEWNTSKNRDIKPESIMQGNSKIKIWWRCNNCGKEWQATAYNRTSNHSGCPQCAIEYRKTHRMYKKE